MKVKTKLQLCITSFLLIFVVVTGLMYKSSRQLYVAMEAHHLAETILNGFSTLNSLAFELVVYGEDRIKQQWLAKYISISNSIKIMPNVSKNNDILSIQSQLQKSKYYFDHLSALINRHSYQEKTNQDQDAARQVLMEAISGQFLASQQSLMSAASILAEKSMELWHVSLDQIFKSIAASLTAILCVIISIFFIITKSVARPLSIVNEGIKQLGSGDLEHRILIKSKDEIGDLSNAFNTMAEKRMKAEEQLMLFQRFAEQSSQGFGIGTLDGKIRYVNKALSKIMEEKDKEAFIGNNFLHYYSREIQRKFQTEIIPTVLREGKWSGEHELVSTKGKIVPTQESYSIIFDEKKDSKNLAAIITDITDRKIAEERLIKEKTFAESTINTMEDVLYVFDLEGRFLRWNNQLSKVTGYSDKEIAQMHPTEFFMGDDIENVTNAISRVIETGFAKVEAMFVTKGARQIPYEFNGSRFEDHEGNVIGVCGTGRDLTEHKQAAKLLKESSERLKDRTAQIEAVNKELESFAYSVSHDLRTPLRAINGFSNILLEEYASVLDKEGQRILSVITNNVEKMGELINDLLAFSRLDRQAMKPSSINIAELATEAMKQIQNGSEKKNLDLKIDDLPEAFGDRNLICVVLMNLLSNAVKYQKNSNRPVIEIGANKNGGHNVYYVKDKGIGFDMKHAGKLFGVFQRLHNAEEFEGTGIGLALVKRIITRHGGRVWADGKVNEGATFYFTLPVKEINHESNGDIIG